MSAVAPSSLRIATPEGVIFSYRLATPASRCLAWVVDAIAIGGISYLLSRLSAVAGFVSTDLANFLSTVLYFVVSVGYGIILEWRWRGQTIGKRLFGLRVIDMHGLRLQFPQIALRNILRLVDALPLLYLVGGSAAFWTRSGQRLGDLAASTVVAHEPDWEMPELEPIAPAKYNSVLQYPRLAARLRSLANPEAVVIALEAVTRRDRYSASGRLELFRDIADYFRSLVPFPEQALEGLSDEQFVRAVVRAIYDRS
jgi:uncharacterized RDD family membrane protein YckC